MTPSSPKSYDGLDKGNVSSMKKIILMTFHQNSGQSNSLFTQIIDFPTLLMSQCSTWFTTVSLDYVTGLNFNEFCRFSLVPQKTTSSKQIMKQWSFLNHTRPIKSTKSCPRLPMNLRNIEDPWKSVSLRI